MSYAEQITITNPDGTDVNPSTEDLQKILMLLLDRLDYGLLVDTAKRLKVTPEQATAANLNATVAIAATQTLSTVTTVGTVTNQSRMGDIQTQRLVEALTDTAFNTGIITNLSF